MKKIFALILFACGIVTAQAQVTGLELPYGIKVLDSLATDAWYGPYPNIDSALSHVPSAVRKNRTVKIDTLEYWWRDGVADEDLVVKTSPGGVDFKAGNGIEIIDGDSLVFVGKNVTVDSIDIMAGKRFSIGFVEGEFAPKAFYADSTFVGTGLSRNLFGQMRYTGSGISHDGYRSTYSSDDNYNFEEYAGIGLPGGGQGSRLEVSNLTSGVTMQREITPDAWSLSKGLSSYTLGNTFTFNSNDKTGIRTYNHTLTGAASVDLTYTKSLGESSFRHMILRLGENQGGSDYPVLRVHGWDGSSSTPDPASETSFAIFANLEISWDGRVRSKSYFQSVATSNQIYLGGPTRQIIINAVQPATTDRTWTIADEGGDRTFASREYVTTQLMDSINNAIDTLSAGGSTNATALRGVNLDASVGSPSDGDILVYRSAGSDWVLEEKPSGGGGGGVEIAEVMDSIANAIDSLVSITQIEAMLDTLDTGGSPDWGDIGGTLSDQTDLKNALDAKADLAGATFTGKVNHTADATNAGVNLGSVSSNPSSLSNGDVWLVASGSHPLRVQVNSATHTLIRSQNNTFPSGVLYAANNAGGITTSSMFTFSGGLLETPSLSVTTGATLPAGTSIGDVSSTEIGYLDNVTSSIQTQLNSKQTITPTSSTGTAVAFDTNRSYCTSASPCTGNITFTSSGAIVGQMATMIHNDSSEPTFGSEFIILSGEYATNEDNYIMFFLRESGKVWVTISQEQ